MAADLKCLIEYLGHTKFLILSNRPLQGLYPGIRLDVEELVLNYIVLNYMAVLNNYNM